MPSTAAVTPMTARAIMSYASSPLTTTATTARAVMAAAAPRAREGDRPGSLVAETPAGAASSMTSTVRSRLTAVLNEPADRGRGREAEHPPERAAQVRLVGEPGRVGGVGQRGARR